MGKKERTDMNTERRTPGTGNRTVLNLIILVLLSAVVISVSRFLGPGARHNTVLVNTMKTVEMISRMRIDLLKSTDLGKGAVMAVTDEESRALAEQSRKSADAVQRDYEELNVLIDAAKIGDEMTLLQEFNDAWNNFREIDRELLSLAVKNTNIKAANLSYTAASQDIGTFERCLSQLMAVPKSDREQAQMARLAYQAVTAAFMIYSLEAPHINEVEDKKMGELEKLMAANEKKVRNALRDLSRPTDQQDRPILHDAAAAFAKFMEVHKEVVRLSRMNTNVKSLELSLGRKRKVAAQCEEILSSLLDTVQNGRSSKATR
ncbi:MAG: hypothetical protein ACYDH8_12050 [Syntrophales bacterium]